MLKQGRKQEQVLTLGTLTIEKRIKRLAGNYLWLLGTEANQCIKRTHNRVYVKVIIVDKAVIVKKPLLIKPYKINLFLVYWI